MSEQTREAIVGRLKREALKDPETGWLSDLARRGLAWEEREEVIAIGKDWFGSVDIGHLAGIVELIAEEHTKKLAEKIESDERGNVALRVLADDRKARADRAEAQVYRVQALANYLETLAPGDKHYSDLINKSLNGGAEVAAVSNTNQEN